MVYTSRGAKPYGEPLWSKAWCSWMLIFTLNSCMWLISCTYVQKMTEASLGLELELLWWEFSLLELPLLRCSFVGCYIEYCVVHTTGLLVDYRLSSRATYCTEVYQHGSAPGHLDHMWMWLTICGAIISWASHDCVAWNPPASAFHKKFHLFNFTISQIAWHLDMRRSDAMQWLRHLNWAGMCSAVASAASAAFDLHSFSSQFLISLSLLSAISSSSYILLWPAV